LSKSKIEKKLLHYVGKAIADYNMIQPGDKVMVCLSGGKDSYTLLNLLHKLRYRTNFKFDVFSYTLDQAQPGWDDTKMRQWLESRQYPYKISRQDTYTVVKKIIPEGKTYCSLCSRLRRGSIYTYAEAHGYTKIALGHHRDDLIETLLMSVMYSGQIRSMPPKLLTDKKNNIVIRPLAYCQEADIITYAEEQDFPIIPCNLCGSQKNMTRQNVKQLIADLASKNPKVPSNILGALGNVRPSQLMDDNHWNFKDLESQVVAPENQGSILETIEKVKSSAVDLVV